jgi:hypothetical protein
MPPTDSGQLMTIEKKTHSLMHSVKKLRVTENRKIGINNQMIATLKLTTVNSQDHLELYNLIWTATPTQSSKIVVHMQWELKELNH